MTKIEELSKLGQSIWYDNISKSIIKNGTVKKLIDQGLKGMTSNPAIFKKSISTSKDYDEQIKKLCQEGKNTFQIYDELTRKDVANASELFRSVYDKTNGLDGYVSLEVNPKLAFNKEETIQEAKRLYKALAKPNIMIKVPATDPGIEAIEELIAEGININITLIFSLQQYEKTARAYIRGVKRLIEKNPEKKVQSVASVFVSRVDGIIDKILDEKQHQDNSISSLKGLAGIANAGRIYKKFQDIFFGEEFSELKEKNVPIQRPLWASTGTKNPAYSDIKYITEFIAKNTVNTVPETTYHFFLEHGEVSENIDQAVQTAEQVINKLDAIGINIDTVCQQLLETGLKSFEDAFEKLLTSIEEKEKKFKLTM